MASINTSKTAHVMNLLSRSRSTPPSEDAPSATPAPAESNAAPAVSAPPPKPIIDPVDSDAAAATQIKDALETALESALEADAPKNTSAPPAKKTGKAPEEPPVAKEALPEDTGHASALSISPDVNEPETAPAPEPPAAEVPTSPEQGPAGQPVSAPMAEPEPDIESELDPELSYVNVTQLLVEEKAEKYMKMFGLCQCSRCKIDVKALALNNLPPKYVVMAHKEFVPRITVYEGQSSSAITAQLLRACKTVMENPRHNL